MKKVQLLTLTGSVATIFLYTHVLQNPSLEQSHSNLLGKYQKASLYKIPNQTDHQSAIFLISAAVGFTVLAGVVTPVVLPLIMIIRSVPTPEEGILIKSELAQKIAIYHLD